MKMTYQPKKRHRAKVHGFRKRMSTKGGRKVLAARRLKGRKEYQLRPQFVVFSSIMKEFVNEVFRIAEKELRFSYCI